jgi:hypothetical protein
VLHGGGRAVGGERRGERHPVVVAPGSWLGEKFGAQAVLTVTSGGAVPWPDSAVPRDVLAAMEGGGGELAGGAPAVDSL